MGKPGKSISVTLPKPLVEDLQKGANKVGISRSRFVSNLLLKWQETNKNLGDHEGQETPPNDCTNRDDDGFCIAFEHICNAKQKDAEPCSGYTNKERIE